MKRRVEIEISLFPDYHAGRWVWAVVGRTYAVMQWDACSHLCVDQLSFSVDEIARSVLGE